MQVLSMRLVEDIPVEEVAPRVNAVLTLPVGLVCAVRAERKFHAGFSASGKEYRYRLAPPELIASRPDWAPFAWATPFDPQRLREALQRFVGTRNYVAFSQKADPAHLRTISAIEVVQLPSGVTEVRVHGSGFGKYMIRYIISAAVRCALGVITLDDITGALDSGQHLRAEKAPPQGLVLWQVKYPPEVDPFSAELRASVRLPPGLPFDETA